MRKTCIACPRGCFLTVERRNDEIIVSGHMCPKGIEYGRQEFVRPMRILTTTVRTSAAERPRLPVRTTGEVPLEAIPELLSAIAEVTVVPPVRCGAVIVDNILDYDVDIIATDTIEL